MPILETADTCTYTTIIVSGIRKIELQIYQVIDNH